MASVSKTDIFNATLRQLGAKRVNSHSDNLPRAKTLTDLYDIVRREMMEDGRFNFAKKRQELTLKGTKPDFGYEYEYELPIGYLTSVKETDDYKFVVENDGILSDESSLKLVYMFDNEDTSTFSATFVRAFYLKLALESCYEITGSNTKENSIRSKFNEAMLLSMGSSSREGDFSAVVTPKVLLNSRRR